MHQSQFKIHASPATNKRKAKYSIIHRIRTSQSLSTIRTYNAISVLLKQHSCYLKGHSWDETVWDVIQTGYLIGLDPKHYTSSEATRFLSDIMEKKSPGKCPPLRMIYSSPSIQVDDRIISTKVFAIEFERKNAKEVLRKLKDAFTGSTQLLLAKLRYTHPKSFANALKMQNKMMNETYVLPMVNISQDEMFYLQPIIEEIAGVMAVVTTGKTLTHGKYNVLITSQRFLEVKSEITQNFDEYYDKVSEEAKQKDNLLFFGQPGIQTVNDRYEESSGELSFLSTSAASFGSLDLSTTEDAYEFFTPAAGAYSWSEVVQQKRQDIPSVVTTPRTSASTAPVASHASSVVTPSERQPPTSEIQSLHEKLKSNATEIAELKAMMTQVLNALSAVGVQGASSTTVSDPPPEPMDINDNTGPQKRGVNDFPFLAETGRNKRFDHKSSPIKKPDFHQDE
jgi:hypothetical protein